MRHIDRTWPVVHCPYIQGSPNGRYSVGTEDGGFPLPFEIRVLVANRGVCGAENDGDDESGRRQRDNPSRLLFSLDPEPQHPYG